MSLRLFSFLKQKLNNLIWDKKFSEILTGSVWALGARVIAMVLGIVTTIFIARFYGAEIMGTVTVINSFLLLATIFTVLGTDTSILRMIPEHLVNCSATSAFKLFRKTQYMVIGISLIIGTLLFLGANIIAEKIFSKPHQSFYFALASVFLVFRSIMLLNTNAVRGLKLIHIFALMQILPQGFNLLLIFLLGVLFTSQNIPIYALLGGFALTGILGGAIMEYSFKKRMQTNDHVQPTSVKSILTLSLPMFMTSTMTIVIGQTGVIILGMLRPEAEVGYYAVAVKLATLTSFLLSAINSMAAPKFAELFQTGQISELFRVAKKSTKLIFWTTTPILFFLIIMGRLVLRFLFGEDFTVAYGAMVFLVIGQFVHSISGSTGYFMNMTGHQKVFQNIMVLTAIMNVILNFALIPRLGIHGAALTGMVSLTFWNISTLLFIKIKYGRTIGYVPLLNRR